MKPACFFSFISALLFSAAASAQIHSKKELEISGEMVSYGTHTTTFDSGSVHLFTTVDLQNVQHLTLVKLSSAGAVQWTRRFDCVSPAYTDVVQSVDSGYYLCYRDYTGMSLYYVIRLDATGNIIFSKQLTVSAPYFIYTTPQIIARADGGCYVAGDLTHLLSTVYMEHVFSLDASGNVLWSNIYNMNPAKSYHADADRCLNGDLVLLSTYYDTSYAPLLSRITPGGTLLWSKYYTVTNHDSFGESVACTPDGRIVVSSMLYHPTFLCNQTALMRCDGQGNELWTFEFSNALKGAQPQFTMAAENNTTITIANALFGSVMMKHDSTGLLLCTRYYSQLALTTADTLIGPGYALAGVDTSSGNLVYLTTGVCGATCGDSSYFILKTPLTTLTTSLTGSASIPLIDSVHVTLIAPPTVHMEEVCSTVGMEEEQQSEIDVYPNPCAGTLFVRNADSFELVVLYDVNGRIVLQQNITGASLEIDVSVLPAGIYTLRLQNDVHFAVRTIAIQSQY